MRSNRPPSSLHQWTNSRPNIKLDTDNQNKQSMVGKKQIRIMHPFLLKFYSTVTDI